MNILKLRWTTAVWSIVYLLLLLSLLTPFSIVTAFLLVLPVAILFTALNTKSFIMHVVPVWLIALLIHPIYLLLAIYFAIPGIVMGYLYRKRKAAMQVLKYGMAVMLVELLVLLMISTAFFQLNLSEYVDEIVKMTTAPLTEMGVEGGLGGQFLGTELDTQLIKDQTMRLVPFAMIISSFLMTVVTHALARPTLNSMGLSVPRLKPAREWMLPRSLIWYYLLIFFINIATVNSDNTFMKMIVANATPLLQICFMIQALSFFYYLAHERKWHPIAPLLTAIPIVLFPPAMIIGILDLAFPLRQAFSKNKR
ncbi:YybS family protein [Paenibacillus lautus]|uniref:DUF2232 domain-containing protein n=1 Tax=Paenibacillus lautus TaxID=1401 RepID=UPI00203ACD32|nr:YybS family protein [Paenibacillus lautus]